jgi:uncharacterized protein GlcG (DUF336 family)
MMTLDIAQNIVAAALAFAREKGFKPMGFVVLDARGALRAAATEDGASLARWKVAYGKAQGAVSMGVSSRALSVMALERPYFVAALPSILPEGVIPVPGGVLIKNSSGAVIGAAGASGDTSDNDEAALMAALACVGLSA